MRGSKSGCYGGREYMEKEHSLNLYTLRKSTAEDVTFLFNVSTRAMRPVVEAVHPDKVFDRVEEFKLYQNKFIPTEIEVIQFQSIDIGRLRIVRSAESIYIGGIQILPEFQNRGIGTVIVTDLIQESNSVGIPITLEVHEVNTKALNFYKKLGFVEVGREEGKLSMRYCRG